MPLVSWPVQEGWDKQTSFLNRSEKEKHRAKSHVREDLQAPASLSTVQTTCWNAMISEESLQRHPPCLQPGDQWHSKNG